MTNPYAPPQAVVDDIAGPQGQIVPAGRLERLGASLLDGVIFVAMVYLPLVIAVLARVDTRPGDDFVIASLAALPGFGVWLWLTIRNMKRNGQSIAKKMLGIKVVRTDGSSASLGRLIWLRNVLNQILGIIPPYGIVDVLFIFGEARQCLHDKIADTIVIKA
ncbi:MAG TPA: RDD family protein [Vicinamibacterales bacterium]|nr:RDD family protein [Vicinamibacterales bacterium]